MSYSLLALGAPFPFAWPVWEFFREFKVGELKCTVLELECTEFVFEEPELDVELLEWAEVDLFEEFELVLFELELELFDFDVALESFGFAITWSPAKLTGRAKPKITTKAATQMNHLLITSPFHS